MVSIFTIDDPTDNKRAHIPQTNQAYIGYNNPVDAASLPGTPYSLLLKSQIIAHLKLYDRNINEVDTLHRRREETFHYEPYLSVS